VSSRASPPRCGFRIDVVTLWVENLVRNKRPPRPWPSPVTRRVAACSKSRSRAVGDLEPVAGDLEPAAVLLISVKVGRPESRSPTAFHQRTGCSPTQPAALPERASPSERIRRKPRKGEIVNGEAVVCSRCPVSVAIEMKGGTDVDIRGWRDAVGANTVRSQPNCHSMTRPRRVVVRGSKIHAFIINVAYVQKSGRIEAVLDNRAFDGAGFIPSLHCSPV